MRNPLAFPRDLPSAQTGMTLRDYFAAKAMQTFVAGNHPADQMSDEDIAMCSYNLAQAMLKEREKQI